jgi:superfamily II DNA or RNA helicase
MLRKRPVLSSMLYVPLTMLSDIERTKQELTFKSFGMELVDGEMRDTVTDIKTYDIHKKGYLGLPRAYGLAKFPKMKYIDGTIRATIADDIPFKTANSIQPRTEQQREFMSGLFMTCTSGNVVDYIANARTGSGKTVSDLWLSAQMGRPTLIIVHTNTLKNQWYGSSEDANGILNFFGEAWTKKYVGFVQQDKCDYRGKIFVIAMGQSLISRDYGEDFYNYFGKITIDEVHKFTAPMMSKILGKFPAAIRGGYTATNKKGALRGVCDVHLGVPKVSSQQAMMKPIVYVVPYREVTKLYGGNMYAQITAVSRLRSRNQFLARLIYKYGYTRGRNILVLSERVDQLQTLAAFMEILGVPENEIGLYVGHKTENGKKIKVKDAEYARIKKDARIIFATYGIFDTGADIARLDMGVEATPRSDVTQAIGRIIREFAGKPTPEWYTMRDDIGYKKYENSDFYTQTVPYPIFEKRFKARVASYRKQNANIKNFSGNCYED